MTLALLLSGQGGQHPGMFDLTAGHPDAQPIFAAAKPLLAGVDPRDLARNGTDALHENRTGQILCCVAALAAWRALGAAGTVRTIVAGCPPITQDRAGHLSPSSIAHKAARASRAST